VVSLVVQSEKQIGYLATNTDTNNLLVLLIAHNIRTIDHFISTVSNQVPTQYEARPLDYLLCSLTETSKRVIWLNLGIPRMHAAPVTDSTVANMQLLPALRALECYGCEKLTRIHVNGLKKLQYLNLSHCSSLTTVQDLAELTALKYLNLSYTQITFSTLAGLSNLTELQQLILNKCNGLDDLPQLGSLKKLIHLELNCCHQLTKLSELQTLVLLKHLEFRGSSCVTTLEVTELTSLLYFDLSHCTVLAMVDVTGLVSLQYLVMFHCENL
jgi:Leucine-rich repeat (LRR) protein